MKMLRRTTQLLSLSVLIVISSQASALSCMRPDPVQSCKSMVEQKQTPLVANGVLKISKIISKEVAQGAIGGKGPMVAEYLFTGTIRDKSGKRNAKGESVRISTSCAGPWCANLPKDNASGYFLLKAADDSGLALHIGPCTFQPFTVTESQADALEACATPEPVTPSKDSANKGGSQIFSQGSSDKKLVQ